MAQRTVIARQGQTMMDIVIQEYGDPNFYHNFVVLNGFKYDHDLKASDSVLVDTDGVGDQKVKDFYARVTVNGQKQSTPVNYGEYKETDYSESDFNTDDYS